MIEEHVPWTAIKPQHISGEVLRNQCEVSDTADIEYCCTALGAAKAGSMKGRHERCAFATGGNIA